MRRYIVVLALVGLVASLLAPTAGAAKKKKKPAPVDVVYHIVWNGDGCALATTTAAANAEEACADVFAGALSAQLGTGPFAMPVLDALPLTLDAAKPIKGKINVQSWYATGEVPDVMGAGMAELNVKLAGTAGGQEVVIGELTTEPYLVTPASADYVVEFEIVPAPELQGTVFDTLTLYLEPGGDQMFHGVMPADGSSTLTIGAFSR